MPSCLVIFLPCHVGILCVIQNSPMQWAMQGYGRSFIGTVVSWKAQLTLGLLLALNSLNQQEDVCMYSLWHILAW